MRAVHECFCAASGFDLFGYLRKLTDGLLAKACAFIGVFDFLRLVAGINIKLLLLPGEDSIL